MNDYDFIIIGGGAGAFAAAIRADELGAKTAMINHGLALGGTCVNVGCVPSKRLLWAGEVLHAAKNGHLPGIKMGVESFDFNKIIQDELELVYRLREEKYQKVMQRLDSTILYQGPAKFVSENTVQVNGKMLQADKILIATGSTAKVPPIPGIGTTGYVTHIGALSLQKLPEQLTIIGAGPVAIEFAQMYSRFGSKVTVIKRSKGILRFAESELTQHLQHLLENEGIQFITYDEILKAEIVDDNKILSIRANGQKLKIQANEILVATGKTPNTQHLNLASAGVRTGADQAIAVNALFQTSNPNIYAVGDVADLPVRLETTAGREGTLAASNALSGTEDHIDYGVVPFTVFTDPQLAGVGLTEKDQMRQMGFCNCRTVKFKDLPKAIIINRTEGMIKMSVDLETERILGVHVLSPNAGELIAAAMFIIQNKNTLDDVINSMPMFPTLSEALKMAALSFKTDINRLSCCV